MRRQLSKSQSRVATMVSLDLVPVTRFTERLNNRLEDASNAIVGGS